MWSGRNATHSTTQATKLSLYRPTRKLNSEFPSILSVRTVRPADIRDKDAFIQHFARKCVENASALSKSRAQLASASRVISGDSVTHSVTESTGYALLLLRERAQFPSFCSFGAHKMRVIYFAVASRTRVCPTSVFRAIRNRPA